MKWLLLLAFAPLLPGNGRYDLDKPIATFDLPIDLTEISGLTDVDEHTVACLHDEEATLFLLDLADGRIRERHVFGPPGDMEGLTRVGNGYYALRSDGLVYHLQCKAERYVAVDSFELRLPNRNIEGLGFDDRLQRVLVSPKDNLKGDPALRDLRQVFAFDPRTHKLLPEPVLSYSVEDILRKAEAGGVKIPMRTTSKGKEIPMVKFRMASVAVDPGTDHYLLLSAVDRTLLVLDREGRYVHLYLLDEMLLPKPEGITFLANGDLLIASEGKNSPPRLARYAAHSK
jgi:uncharacterized protein YjiK